MQNNLKNKVFFISGSTSGIGFGIAKSLIKLDAKVVITGTSEKKIIKIKSKFNNNNNILIINSDLTNEINCKKAIKKTIEYFKKIDCLVLNLGSGKQNKAKSFNKKAIEEMFKINFWPSFSLCEHSLPYLKKTKGSVIAVSSICGTNIIENAPIGYSIAKSALNKMIKIYAKQYAKFKIRFNTIVPGNIMFKGSTWEKKINIDPNGVNRMLKNDVPLKSFGSIDDIFQAILYLSNDKNKFITGSELFIDGGQSI